MKKHWFWFVEVLIWLLILFSLASVIMIGRYSQRKDFNTYQIFLPDVDGLTNGSPVRLMGIQVGYVNQVDIVGEDVYVKFIVTQRNVKIPLGATATVEFTGLGGSKSLELYPPNEKPVIQSKFIITKSPKRINDSAGVLNDMFNQIIEITYTVSNFMDKIGVIKTQKCYNGDKNPSFEKIIDDSSEWLDRAQEQTEKLNQKIKGIKQKNKGK